MYPLLPFAAGMLAGAVVARLVKADRARVGLDRAQERLRDATVSGLAALEHSSAELRAKLAPASDEEGGAQRATPPDASRPSAPAVDSATSEGPASPRSRRRAAQAAPDDGTPPARKPARRRAAPKAAASDDNTGEAEQ